MADPIQDTPYARAAAFLAGGFPFAITNFPNTGSGVIDDDRRIGLWQYIGFPIDPPASVPGVVQIEENVEIGLTQSLLVDVTVSLPLTMRIGRTQAFDVER